MLYQVNTTSRVNLRVQQIYRRDKTVVLVPGKRKGLDCLELAKNGDLMQGNRKGAMLMELNCWFPLN